MLLQLLICLAALSAASLLVTQGRRRRIWSIIMLFMLVAVSYFLLRGYDNEQTGNFIYQWLPYKSLKADINISSSKNMRQMFFPLFLLLSGTVYLTTIFPFEKHSLHFNTLMLLCFISLILQTSSHDFLQLIFSGSMFSIISFYMPDEITAKKKIFIFNFLAEMSLFMAASVIYASTNTLNLSALDEYVDFGAHKDLAAVLVLLAVGIKCGLFMLNSHYQALKDISLNRIAGIFSLSVPLSGIVLAFKLYPLLGIFPKSVIIFWIVITLIYSFMQALFNCNLKSKMIFLFTASYSFILLNIVEDFGDAQLYIPRLLIINFIISFTFILSYLAASGEENMNFTGGFFRYSPLNAFSCVISMLCLIAAFSELSVSIYSKIFFLLYIVVIGCFIRTFYFGKCRADEKVIAFAKNSGVLYILPLLVVSILIFLHSIQWKNYDFYIGEVCFLLILLFCPTAKILRLGSASLFSRDLVLSLYEIVIIKPLNYFGRILWLFFDIVLIEHNMIGNISDAFASMVLRLRNFQDFRVLGYLVSFAIGIVVVILYIGCRLYD